ncbi:MAG: alpha-amylase family glycosyl hydrolase [Bacteroidota bacterium]|nr:alpha-amylase family glycosyl hydrolase [Bacteroidota bacterium]
MGARERKTINEYRRCKQFSIISLIQLRFNIRGNLKQFNDPMNFFNRSFLFGFFIISASSPFCFTQELSDIIQPIHINSEKQDTILVSDLFYAKNYDIQFSKNKNLTVSFDKVANTVVIAPNAKRVGATVLEFKMHGIKNDIPVIIDNGTLTRQVHKFSFKPDSAVKTVVVTGSFNNWDKERDQLKDINGNGIYELSKPLEPGSYIYKFIVDGKEVLDPVNPEKTPTGFDNFNSVLRISDADTSTMFLHIGERRKMNNSIVYSFVYENSNQQNPLSKIDIIALLDNTKVNDREISVSGDTITFHFKAKELRGEKTLRVLVTQNGKNTNLQQVKMADGEPAGKNSQNLSWDDGVIYSIMVDRFKDGDTTNDKPVVHDSIAVQANYRGGDFKGIISKIDDGYFDSLGVNILWISPVYDNPDVAFREYPPPHRWYSGYHGYWPVGENQVEEKFGTMAELQELVAKAHQHKMKVLLDIVAHHVHIDNPLFKEHPDWFGTLDLPDGRKNLRLWDEYRLTTWFEPYMPSFDFARSQEAVDSISDNAIWWLETTGADGFRHDAVKHVPNNFWRTLTRKLKEKIEIPMHKEVYQIGETFGDYDLIASYVNNGQLSAQFNFNLSYFAIPVFIESDKSFASIDFHMKKSFSAFGYNNLMGNIMDSHDKVRFMAYADGAIKMQGVDTREIAWNNPPVVHNPKSYNKAKLYLAYMFTIPGLPVVYYGSEFGMTGADDPDNRRMMRFGNALSIYEEQMLHETKKIIALRNQHSALRYGDFLTLRADESVYAYIRSDMNERVLVVLNKNENAQTFDLHIPPMYQSHELSSATNGEKIEVKGNVATVTVRPIGWRVYQIK